MDLKDIESWGRELLEHEAGKRGVRSPEVYSRTELVRLILKHDYGAPRNVKEAARLIGGIFGTAREVLKKRLGPLQPPGVKTFVGAATETKWGGAGTRREDAGNAGGRELGAARAGRRVEAERGGKSSPREVAGSAASEDLERSYVGDRKLDLPTSGEAAGAASSYAPPEIERSYVGGRKLDLAGVAVEGAPVRDVERSQVGGSTADQAAANDSLQDRSLDEADELRAAEQARAEARELRRESERVRSDSRAAAQHEADRPRPEPGWHRVRLGRDLPPTAAKPVSGRGEVPVDVRDAEADRSGAQLKIFDTGAARGDAELNPNPAAARGDSPATSSSSEATREANDAQVAHLRLVEPLPRSEDEVQAAAAEPAQAAPGAPESTEQLTYGPHPKDGMLLRWRVTSEAIERARQLLGTKGELAVRIVAVRVEPHAVVKTDVIDHGPVSEAGDWTAPLLPTEAKYVSSIGLRSANKFVSIVHAKS